MLSALFIDLLNSKKFKKFKNTYPQQSGTVKESRSMPSSYWSVLDRPLGVGVLEVVESDWFLRFADRSGVFVPAGSCNDDVCMLITSEPRLPGLPFIDENFAGIVFTGACSRGSVFFSFIIHHDVRMGTKIHRKQMRNPQDKPSIIAMGTMTANRRNRSTKNPNRNTTVHTKPLGEAANALENRLGNAPLGTSRSSWSDNANADTSNPTKIPPMTDHSFRMVQPFAASPPFIASFDKAVRSMAPLPNAAGWRVGKAQKFQYSAKTKN